MPGLFFFFGAAAKHSRQDLAILRGRWRVIPRDQARLTRKVLGLSIFQKCKRHAAFQRRAMRELPSLPAQKKLRLDNHLSAKRRDAIQKRAPPRDESKRIMKIFCGVSEIAPPRAAANLCEDSKSWTRAPAHCARRSGDGA